MSARPFALGVLLLAAACSGGGKKAAGPTTSTIGGLGSTTVTLNAANATAPTIPPTTVVEDAEVPPGKSFGFITAFDGTEKASFDLASYLTGAEADKAAIEDGVIKPGEHVENDYYIRNKNPKLRTINLGPSVVVYLSDCSSGPCKQVRADLDALKKRPTPIPVWISVFKYTVIRIDEQYRP
jgi:hypothetical protein